MTWILPRQLHTLAYALDTEALSLDSSEQSQICAQSLFVRSKPSPSQIWLRKWKRDSWTRHLSGRILRPSLGNRFADAWISSLADILASPLARQESDKEQTIRDISGHTSQGEFGFSNQDSASLKTSKDISRWGCPTSSKTWQEWVTEQRGEYSARLKLARLTSESGSSSWPTATTRDWKDTGDMSQSMIRKDGKERMDTLGRVVQVNHNTHGSRPESWATPRCSMAQDKQEDSGKSRLGEQAQHNTGGKLNPRWVDVLLGLPIGWTMPSCACPVTIVPTNCASSGTE